MATLFVEKLQPLLTTITATAAVAASVPAPGTSSAKNDPAALGPIRQCSLGSDKMRKLALFNEWLKEEENRIDYIGVTNDKEKIILLKTWGGSDITELIKLEKSPLNIKTEPTADGETPAEVTHIQLIERLRVYLSKMVNRTMAMHQLLTIQQGTRSWSDFMRDLERK